MEAYVGRNQNGFRGNIMWTGALNRYGRAKAAAFTKFPTYITGHFGQPTTPGKPARKRVRELLRSQGIVNVHHKAS